MIALHAGGEQIVDTECAVSGAEGGQGPARERAAQRVNARLIRYRASAVEAWLASREVQPS